MRPRIGDFLYSKEEFDVMLEDIRVFKQCGAVRGMAIGILTAEGQVDVPRTKMSVFHFSKTSYFWYKLLY